MLVRGNVFYGWWIVAASIIGLFFSAPPISVFSFGVFLKPLILDFHASRSAVALAFTLHNLMGAAGAPFAGRLADRVGARRVLLAGNVCFVLILFSSRRIGSHIGYLYLFYAALGAVAPFTVLPYTAIICRWFDRLRGLALGLMMLGMGLGAMVVPSVTFRIVSRFGWRAGFFAFGLTVLFVAIPVVAGLLRNQPRDMNLAPYGLAAHGADRLPACEPPTTDGLPWYEIWHKPLFWLLLSAFALVGTSVHAAALHLPALLTDRGVSARSAAAASSVLGAALLIGRVFTGYALDRLPASRITLIFFGSAAVGIALLLAGAAAGTGMLAAFLIGLGFGAESDVIAFCISRYFGLRAFGTAYGCAFGAFVLAGAVGPLLMAVGFDQTHSYTLPLSGFFLTTACGVLLLSRLGPYTYVPAPAEPTVAATPPLVPSTG